MVRSACCVEGCWSSSNNGDKMYRFPKNPNRAAVWASLVGQPCSLETAKKLFNTRVVCYRHFTDEQFTTPDRLKLGTNAIPCIEHVSGLQSHNVHESSPMQMQLVFDDALQIPIPSNTIPSVPSTSTVQSLSLTSNSSYSLPSTSTSFIIFNNPSQSSTPLQSSKQSCAASEASCSVSPIPSVGALAGIKPPSVPTKRPKARRRLRLNDLGVRKIIDLTPRKQKLYVQLNAAGGDLAKLKRKFKKRSIKIKGQATCEDYMVHALAYLQEEAKKLLLEVLENSPRGPQGRRWTENAKIISLVIQKQSRRAYVLLRKLFPLPSPRTLQSLLNTVPFGVGINTRILDTLGRSVQNLPESERFCCLMFDDMALRQNLVYNQARDCIEGFQDYGNIELPSKYLPKKDTIAKYALVFMVRGIQSRKFKQPVAYYFHNGMKAEILVPLLKKVLDECARAGLRIVATVCDMGANNVKALLSMRPGEDEEIPYIEHNEQKIATVFDPPHLLKCTRNMFLKYDVHCKFERDDSPLQTGIAKWSHLVQLHEMDRQNGLRCMRKIDSKAHLEPTSFEKMKVSIAAQVMSRTVADGLLTYACLKGFIEYVPTGDFIEFVNHLFDSCNGFGRPKLPSVGTNLKCQIDDSSPHTEFWAGAKDRIQQWTFLKKNGVAEPDRFKKGNVAPRPPFVRGWLTTIGAMEYTWKYLRDQGMDGLAPRSLNQDPLENTFGAIRAHCGGNNNPNVQQFVDGLKTCVINNLSVRVASKNTNCEEDDTSMLTNLHSFFKDPEPSEESQATFTPDSAEDTLLEYEHYKESLQTPDNATGTDKLASAYVGGFVAKRILEGRSCEECSKSLSTGPELRPETTFIFFKEHSENKQSLTYPTTGLVQTVHIAVSLMDNILKVSAHSGPKLGARIAAKLKNLDFQWIDCAVHHQEVVDSIILSMIKIYVPWWCRLQNRSLREEIRRSKENRKVGINTRVANAVTQ